MLRIKCDFLHCAINGIWNDLHTFSLADRKIKGNDFLSEPTAVLESDFKSYQLYSVNHFKVIYIRPTQTITVLFF